MELRVREYRESDAEALAVLFFESVRKGTTDHYNESQREAWAPTVPDIGEFASRLATMTVTVAEDEGGVVGFMTLDETGYIDLAYVEPDRIGTGVGSAIYEHVEAESKRRGQARLFVNASEVAKPFFEKHGWTVTSTHQVECRGEELTSHRMEKLLD